MAGKRTRYPNKFSEFSFSVLSFSHSMSMFRFITHTGKWLILCWLALFTVCSVARSRLHCVRSIFLYNNMLFIARTVCAFGVLSSIAPPQSSLLESTSLSLGEFYTIFCCCLFVCSVCTSHGTYIFVEAISMAWFISFIVIWCEMKWCTQRLFMRLGIWLLCWHEVNCLSRFDRNDSEQQTKKNECFPLRHITTTTIKHKTAGSKLRWEKDRKRPSII